MRNIFLLFVLCLVSICSLSQEAGNRTDAKGLKQGRWVSRYPSGTLRYEGSFVNDKPVGEWKRYHENGKIKALLSYRAKSDRLFASLFDTDGKLYAKGVFEGTIRDSTWNFYSGEKIVQIENYLLGKKEGKSTGFDQYGKVLWEREWKKDQLDGKSIEYYPTGLKRNEISFVEGIKNGVAQFYDQDGNLSMQGFYKDDLSDGDWKVFEKDGRIKYQIKYAKGDILNSGALDSLQLKEFKKYDNVKGKIADPALNESGKP